MNHDLSSCKTFPVFRLNFINPLKRQNLSFSCFSFCVILSSWINPLLSQQHKTDSLLNLLKTSKPDTNRVKIYYYLSDSNYDSDPYKSIEYAKEGLSLSEEVGFDHGASICLNAVGLAFSQLGKFDSALFYFKERYKVVSELDDKMGIASTYDNLGITYIHFGKVDSALALRLKANEIYLSLNKKDLLASGYNWIGNIDKEKGDYSLALEYFMKSLKIYEDENDKENAGYPLLNISSIYRYMKDILQFQEKSLKNKNLAILISGSGAGIVLLMLFLGAFFYVGKDRAYKNLVYQNLVIADERLKESMIKNSFIERPVEIAENGKHTNSILDEEHKKQILNCLQESVKSKVFTEPNLSIVTLAER
jgi:tetratricopeptide (TPR) repeat protein